MSERYSDETTNKLARRALYLEKRKRFEDALGIYQDLASDKNEFAIERIPLIRYKIQEQKLRKVNLLITIVSLFAVAAGISIATFNTAKHLVLYPKINTLQNTQSTESINSKIETLNFNHHSIETLPHNVEESNFEIYVSDDITLKALNKRVEETLTIYQSELINTEDQFIATIKNYAGGKILGYIEYSNSTPETCDVFLLKK